MSIVSRSVIGVRDHGMEINRQSARTLTAACNRLKYQLQDRERVSRP